MLRGLDFFLFAVNHLFPFPGVGAAWLARAARLELYFKGVDALERVALVALFTKTVWNDKMDYAALALACYLTALDSAPEYEIWHRVAPSTPRDSTGLLLMDVYQRPRLVDAVPSPTDDTHSTSTELPPVSAAEEEANPE